MFDMPLKKEAKPNKTILSPDIRKLPSRLNILGLGKNNNLGKGKLRPRTCKNQLNNCLVSHRAHAEGLGK